MEQHDTDDLSLTQTLWLLTVLIPATLPQDMDDMDADLFAPKKKSSSAPPLATAKASGAGGTKQNPARSVEGGAPEPRHVIG